MRFIPKGKYEVTIEIDDSRTVGDSIYTNAVFVSKDQPGAEIHVAYADGQDFWVSFYKDQKLHRTDGPAHIVFNPDGSILEQTFSLDGQVVAPFPNIPPGPML